MQWMRESFFKYGKNGVFHTFHFEAEKEKLTNSFQFLKNHYFSAFLATTHLQQQKHKNITFDCVTSLI